MSRVSKAIGDGSPSEFGSGGIAVGLDIRNALQQEFDAREFTQRLRIQRRLSIEVGER